MNLREVHIVNDRQSGLGVVTAGDAGQDVNSAGLQLLQLSLGNDEDIDNGLDGGSLTLEVALELRVDGQSALLGALIPVGDNVSAGEGVGGDVVTALVQVSGGDVLTGVVLSVELVGQVAAFAVVLDFHAIAQPQAQRSGIKRGIGVSEVVRQVVGGHGHGVGVLVQQADAGEDLGGSLSLFAGVGVEFLVAHEGLAGGTGHTGGDSHRSGERHNLRQIVGSGDGGAIGEGQALVDGHGVSSGAVVVVSLGVILDSGLVPDVSAALVGLHSAVADGQLLDVLVGSAGGRSAPAGITEVAGQLGVAAQNRAVGRSGCCCSICFGLSGHVGSSRCSSLGGAIGTAGSQTQHHNDCQKQAQKLGELFHSEFLPQKFLRQTIRSHPSDLRPSGGIPPRNVTYIMHYPSLVVKCFLHFIGFYKKRTISSCFLCAWTNPKPIP